MPAFSIVSSHQMPVNGGNSNLILNMSFVDVLARGRAVPSLTLSQNSAVFSVDDVHVCARGYTYTCVRL